MSVVVVVGLLSAPLSSYSRDSCHTFCGNHFACHYLLINIGIYFRNEDDKLLNLHVYGMNNDNTVFYTMLYHKESTIF